MRLATFRTPDGIVAAGAMVDDEVVPLSAIDPALPTTLKGVLEAGDDALARIRSGLGAAKHRLELDDVELLAPIRRPAKFLAIGLNYASHVEEARAMGVPIPDMRYQIWFNKQTSCIVGPTDAIHLPRVSAQLDFEGELAVVIGRRCRHVAAADAPRVVAGYMVSNDVSVRDWQKRTPTATLGKSFDTHGPTGPWLTTADEIPDPHALAVRTLVDGVVMQSGNTGEMVHRIPEMIAYLTTVMTLEPGDIIATGTPAGVGGSRTPPAWLRVGQRVRVEIEALGELDNPVIDEPASSA